MSLLPVNSFLPGLRVIAACRPLVLQQQKISSRSICMTFPRPISINKGHRSSPSSRWVSSSSPHKSQSLPQDKEDKEFSSNSDSGARSSEESVKEQILEAALNHVNSQGWNVNAISQGAADLGLSSAVSGIFKDVDLAHFFIIKSNDALEGYLEEKAGPSPPPKSKLASVEDALLFRLEQVFPYAPRYSEAIVHLLTPQNAPHSTKLLLELADIIAHHSLGDSSTDTTWYIRRLNIARLYVESELCLVQDSSQDYSQTRDFVKRRLSSVSSLDVPQLLPSPESIRVGLVTLANLFKINAPR